MKKRYEVFILFLILSVSVGCGHADSLEDIENITFIEPMRIYGANATDKTQLQDMGNYYRMWNNHAEIEIYKDTAGYNKYYQNDFSDVVVYNERVFLQYWRTQGGGQWRDIGIPQATFSFQFENGYGVKRWYTDFLGTEYTVTYLLSDGNPLKININVLSGDDRTYRINWDLNGITGDDYFIRDGVHYFGESIEDYVLRVGYRDITRLFGDVVDFEYDITAQGRKANFYIGSFDIDDGETLEIDPTIALHVVDDSELLVETEEGNVSINLTRVYPFDSSEISIQIKGNNSVKFWYEIEVPEQTEGEITLVINSDFPLENRVQVKEIWDYNQTEVCFNWYEEELEEWIYECKNETNYFKVNITEYSDFFTYSDFTLSFHDLTKSGFKMNITKINEYNYMIKIPVSEEQMPDNLIVLDPLTYADGWIQVDQYAEMNLIWSAFWRTYPEIFKCNTPRDYCSLNAKMNITSGGWFNITSNDTLIINSSSDGEFRIENWGNLTVHNATIKANGTTHRWSIWSHPDSRTELYNSYFQTFGWEDAYEYEYGIFLQSDRCLLHDSDFNLTAAIMIDTDYCVISNNRIRGNNVLDGTGYDQTNGLIFAYSDYADYNNVTDNIIIDFDSCGGKCTDWGIRLIGTNNNIFNNTISYIGGQDVGGGGYESGRGIDLWGVNGWGSDTNNNRIEENFIHHIDSHEQSSSSAGIYIYASNNIFKNNIIENSVDYSNTPCVFINGGRYNKFYNDYFSECTNDQLILDNIGASERADYNEFYNLFSQTNWYGGFTISGGDNNFFQNVTSKSGYWDTSEQALDITDGKYNIFENSTFTGIDLIQPSQVGVRFANYLTTNNNITNSSIYGRLYGVHFLLNATDNFIIDSLINSGGMIANKDVQVQTGDGGRTNHLLNVTLVHGEGDINFAFFTWDYRIALDWWADYYVNDSDGIPLSGSNVTAYNNTNLINIFSSVWTSSDGYARTWLTEYHKNKTSTFVYNDYILNATLTGYNHSDQTVTHEDNTLYNFTLNIPFIPPVPVTDEDNLKLFFREPRKIYWFDHIPYLRVFLEFMGVVDKGVFY